MRGLQPTSAASLPTRARSAKTLASYPITAVVVAQLFSIRPRTSEYRGKSHCCMRAQTEWVNLYRKNHFYSTVHVVHDLRTRDLLKPWYTVASPSLLFIFYVSKGKRGELTPAKSTKKPLFNQDKPPPHMRGLQPTSAASLPTRARSAKTLASYPITAVVVAQLFSIRPRTSEQRGKTQERQQTVLIGQAGAGRAYDRSGRGRNKNDDEKGSGEAGNSDKVDSDANEKERGTDSDDDEGSE